MFFTQNVTPNPESILITVFIAEIDGFHRLAVDAWELHSLAIAYTLPLDVADVFAVAGKYEKGHQVRQYFSLQTQTLTSSTLGRRGFGILKTNWTNY